MLPAIAHTNKKSYYKRSPQITPLLNNSTEPLTADEYESNLYRSMHRFLIISELFACRPYGAHQHIPSNGRCHQLLLLCQLIWCIIIYITLFVGMYYEHTQSNSKLPTVQKPLYICEYFVYLLHTFCIFVTTYTCHQRIRRLIRTIAEFDQTLSSCFGSKHNYKKLQRFIRVHMLFILLYFIFTVIVNYYYKKGLFIPYLRSLVAYMLANLILCFSVVQYYIFLYVIKQRVIRLNKVLVVELSQKASSKILWEKLQRIRLLYSSLQVFTKEVNNLYGSSVVLIYCGSVTNLSVNVFLLYKHLEEISDLKLAWIMFSLVWVGMHIAKMFLILYYNSGVEDQKTNTALLINEIKAQDAAMEDMIEHFTLQVSINTRSNVVCGLVVLDMSFVTSILVAVTTLFIFLLQYDITYNALTQTRISANLD